MFLNFSGKEVGHFSTDAKSIAPFLLRAHFFPQGKPIISRITIYIFYIHSSNLSRFFVLIALYLFFEVKNFECVIKVNLSFAFSWKESIISSLVLLLSW